MKFKNFSGAARAALMILIVVTLVLVPGAWSQSKYKVLYKFTGGKDGGSPKGGLIFDKLGNLYGTTYTGGAFGPGVVFRLTPGSVGWTESVLYSFVDSLYGGRPSAALVFDQAGNLYGTTQYGGTNGHGSVFKLTPKADGKWTESVLHSFTLGTDGGWPTSGLVFDQAGNLYGTTAAAGAFDHGTVFKLMPNPDGSWSESVVYDFAGTGDRPYAGVIFDKSGNLYGTTFYGGSKSKVCGAGCGVVFKLTPNADGSWTESVLHPFAGGKDGSYPTDDLISDDAGNLYGTTSSGDYKCKSSNSCGTVFGLFPKPDGSWEYKVLHHFSGGTDGAFSWAALTLDHAGNLYGTAGQGGRVASCGVVFMLAPNSTGGWKETVLHAFAGKPSCYPLAGMIFDAAGNLYGTTDGANYGTVFEITP